VGYGELQRNGEHVHRIEFRGIAHEKASVTTPGSQTHCKDFFLGNYLLKPGPKGILLSVNLLSSEATA